MKVFFILYNMQQDIKYNLYDNILGLYFNLIFMHKYTIDSRCLTTYMEDKC